MIRFKKYIQIINEAEILPWRPPSGWNPFPGIDQNFPPYMNPHRGWDNTPPNWILPDGSLDFNGDGIPDTQEEIDEILRSGRIPSDYLVDQPFWYRFIWSWYNVGQWILPFGTISRATGAFMRLIYHLIQHGMVIQDFLDIRELIKALVELQDLNGDGRVDQQDWELFYNSDIADAISQLLQALGSDNPADLLEFIDTIGDVFNNPDILQQILQGLYEVPPMQANKSYYLQLPDGRLQLYRWDPNTNSYQPFGQPISFQDWLNQCSAEGSNCSPLIKRPEGADDDWTPTGWIQQAGEYNQDGLVDDSVINPTYEPPSIDDMWTNPKA